MDFICDGCGKYSYIPPTEEEKRVAIENLEELLLGFQTEPWQIRWLEHHEPELMRRFYDAIDKLKAK